MDIQPITYQGRTLAACTQRRVFLSDELEDHPHTALTGFVLAMCMYAGQILNGLAPGPYREAGARAYARELLIPAELVEHPGPGQQLDIDAAAHALGVPAEELRHQLHHVAPVTAPTSPRRRPRPVAPPRHD
jgi:hypothetical protein